MNLYEIRIKIVYFLNWVEIWCGPSHISSIISLTNGIDVTNLILFPELQLKDVVKAIRQLRWLAIHFCQEARRNMQGLAAIRHGNLTRLNAADKFGYFYQWKMLVMWNLFENIDRLFVDTFNILENIYQGRYQNISQKMMNLYVPNGGCSVPKET